MAQWVKNLVLSLLWHGFDPPPRNFNMGKKKKIQRASNVSGIVLRPGERVSKGNP